MQCNQLQYFQILFYFYLMHQNQMQYFEILFHLHLMHNTQKRHFGNHQNLFVMHCIQKRYFGNHLNYLEMLDTQTQYYYCPNFEKQDHLNLYLQSLSMYSRSKNPMHHPKKLCCHKHPDPLEPRQFHQRFPA